MTFEIINSFSKLSCIMYQGKMFELNLVINIPHMITYQVHVCHSFHLQCLILDRKSYYACFRKLPYYPLYGMANFAVMVHFLIPTLFCMFHHKNTDIVFHNCMFIVSVAYNTIHSNLHERIALLL